MAEDFLKIISKERIMLYFSSFFTSHNLSMTITYQHNGNIVPVYDAELMDGLCSTKFKENSNECQNCRELVHKKVSNLKYDEYLCNIENSEWLKENCGDEETCPQGYLILGFPIWHLKERSEKKVVAVLQTSFGSNLNGIVNMTKFALDMSHIYTGEYRLQSSKIKFTRWYEDKWPQIQKELLTAEIKREDVCHNRFAKLLLDKLKDSLDLEFADYWGINRTENGDSILILKANLEFEKEEQFFEVNPIVQDYKKSFLGEIAIKKEIVSYTDFTQIKKYQWEQLKDYIGGRNIIIVPLIKDSDKIGEEPIAVITMIPHNKDFTFTEHIKNVLEEIRPILTIAVERSKDLVANNRKDIFRDSLKNINAKTRHDFIHAFISIIDDMYKESKVEYYYKDGSGKILSNTGGTPPSISEDRLKIINAVFEYANTEHMQKKAYGKLYYNSISGRKKEPWAVIVSSVHDYTIPERPVIGVIECYQVFDSKKRNQHILNLRDLKYLEYITSVFSIYNSLYSPVEQAIWVSHQLGHEVIKPLSTFVESFDSLLLYLKAEKLDLFNDRYKQIRWLNKYVMYYIQNFTALTSLDVSKEPKTKRDFRVDILDNLITLLEPFANQERGISIKIEQNSVFPKNYNMHYFLLYRAFFNVIMNAIKYSYKNDNLVRKSNKNKEDILISGMRINYPGIWQISIKNFGIGVPEKEKDKIYDIMYRAPNTYSHDGTGMGYGLFITQNVIKIHDGEIILSHTGEKPEDVTEFLINLPIQSF